MTKNSIFLLKKFEDAQKNFYEVASMCKFSFYPDLDSGFNFFILFIRKLRHNFFLSQEAQVKNKFFYFFQDTWKKLLLSRIRLWNYFLMVKKFIYQLIPAQKYFLDGKMIFLNFTSEIQRIYKNFESQEVV